MAQANYWRSHIVIPYMFREMHNNARSSEVSTIRELNQAALLSLIPGMSGIVGGAAKAAALLKWKNLVQTGARWDHKPILRKMLQLTQNDHHFPIQGDPDHEYFYDIWSNIHYGYVGRAAGFTATELQLGHQMGGSAGQTDPMDIETVQLGIDLWNQYELNLTQTQFHQAILNRRARMLQVQATPQYQQAVGSGFQHITPITDGQ